ncbi:conjugal transfer protein TraN [Photobacterium damselae subsp. damselae]|uniref:Conjugal transfer protein TraN n=1 Tax=Photobacterium damselae subsp. damselae TaxID=85581 RepID=A0A850QQL2_PHODD|nr:conjugal transfer protein TraN [Photobacterium damselae subsp. damselae]
MLYGLELTKRLWFKAIVYILLVTTQVSYSSIAYANVNFERSKQAQEQKAFDQAVQQANEYGKQLMNNVPDLNVNSDGSLIHNGIEIKQNELAGATEADFVPTDELEQMYGNDLKTLIEGQKANALYQNKQQEDGTKIDNSSTKAYDMIKSSFGIQRPDLTNDPFWETTDKVLGDLEELAKDFATCTVSTDKYPTGNDIHVEKLETCERVIALEDSFHVSHPYEVGIIKHASGAVNLNSCGDNCTKMWIGRVGDNYWGGWCKIYEEAMSIQVIRPDAIQNATLEYSKFDDYHQVWINGTKVYNAPNGNFPPETAGECELSTSWETSPNINVTEFYRSVKPKEEVEFKTRTSVSGNGEGYSRIQITYDPSKIISDDIWGTAKDLEKALQIQGQIQDGICTGSLECVDMPVLDANRCTVINGVKVCEHQFKPSPLKGISPFCRKVAVNSSCGNREVCWENLQGETVCHDNKLTDNCKPYIENNFPSEPAKKCSFKKSECLDGATAANGTCYVYEDTYDCGFTVNDGAEGETDALICDGQLKCIGESCYKPNKDAPNNQFAEAVAYLEMLNFAKNDMKCENIPDAPYNPEQVPDEYLPVPVCPTGYTYDKITKQCLKQDVCKFDQSNYYKVDPRAGIEAKFNSSIIAKNSDVTKCSPIKNGNTIYTCGVEKERIATEVKSEICTNDYASQGGKGCPDPTHELDPISGFCRVVPIMACPDGYKLVDKGGDKFDKNNFVCRADPVNATANCPANAPYYDPQLKQCIGSGSSNSWFECPQGALTGDRCKFQQNIIKYCPQGSLVGDKCRTQQNSISYCPSGDLINGQCRIKKEECRYSKREGYYTRAQGRFVSYYWNGTRVGMISNGSDSWNQIGGDWYKMGNFRESMMLPPPQVAQVSFYDICRKIDRYIPASKRCNSGYYLSGNICLKDTAYTKKCPSGYYIEGNYCVKYNSADRKCPAGSTFNPSTGYCEYRVTAGASYVCPNGFTYDANKNLCTKPDISATASCPAAYPEYDESTRSCKSKQPSISDYYPKNKATVGYSLFSHFENSDNEVTDHLEQQEKEPVKVRMKRYAEEKLSILTDEANNLSDSERKAYANYKRNLFSMLVTESSDSRFDVKLKQNSPKNSGTDNVSCTLFPAEAAYCKKAVGGIQNCCDNPAPTSLGDYINLTKTMLQLDGLTAELELIGDYTGVWQPAKDYVTGMFDDLAAKLSETVFSSSADVASGQVVAAEPITMAGLQQQAMSYTNKFITDTFGKEVSKLLFQTSTDGTVQLSAGMQQAAAVFTYLYYAYMVYVVVNLLINIIWECTEDEMNLAMKRDLLSTHKIGSYCHKKVLGLCIEKRDVHCVYNSPVSRIMMEQIHLQPQMQSRGYTYGSPKNPVCRSLTTDDIKYVDFEKVDLSEWIGILIQTDNMPNASKVSVESLTGNKSYLNFSDSKPRLNIIEQTKERMGNINADQISRDAYEAKWNSNQTDK